MPCLSLLHALQIDEESVSKTLQVVKRCFTPFRTTLFYVIPIPYTKHRIPSPIIVVNFQLLSLIIIYLHQHFYGARDGPMSRKTSAKGGVASDKEPETRDKKPFGANAISLAFRLEVLTISAFCTLVFLSKAAAVLTFYRP